MDYQVDQLLLKFRLDLGMNSPNEQTTTKAVINRPKKARLEKMGMILFYQKTGFYYIAAQLFNL